MKVKIGYPRSGKTIECIEQAHKSMAYIIVTDMNEAKRVFRLANELEMPIRFPITFYEFLESGKMRGSYVRNVIIDNVDIMIERMFGGMNIELVTMGMNNEDR